MAVSLIQKKSRDFAIRIIGCYKFLCEKKSEYVLSKQLLRSGTSIGANTHEAVNARRLIAQRFEASFVRACLYDFYRRVV
ncbi:MAG: four helix bundle protein [Bacteroidaceae bacterium]|nr:four helix bundle protein [Bacteroidaceae bacterium]